MTASNFAAHAFHDSFANGRASGELQLTESALIFIRENTRVALPFDGLRIKLGGAADRLVFFEHPAQPQWSIHTADLAVLRHPLLRQHPQLAQMIAGLRAHRGRNRALLTLAVLLIVALPCALLLNLGWLTGAAARQVPPAWEEKLGRSVFAQYRLQHELLDGPATAAPLQQLTEPLTAALQPQPYPFEFHIVNDASLNAFALPGGVVVINSGLIERADSASELLGVVAHEISHVTERHGVRNIIGSAGIVLTAQVLIGDASGLLATIASAAPLLLNQSYSRNFERDADTRGVALLRRAQIDPRGLESFFRKMLEQEQKMKAQVGNDDAAAALDSLSRFLSTHPATEERIERIRKLAADAHGPYRDLEPAFAQLKAALAAQKRTATPPPDTSGNSDQNDTDKDNQHADQN